VPDTSITPEAGHLRLATLRLGQRKNKRAALQIANPSFDVPVSPSSPDAGPSSKARGHKGDSFSHLQ
ncbi:hypothetical protein KUCAC02_011520, partial [Chaenocephalus aceratus]